METNSTEIYKIFSSYDSIAIVAHTNPDGDAVSSALAMALSLKTLGKTPVILIDSFLDKYKRVLAGFDMIYEGDYDTLQADIVISVDCGDKKRMGRAEAVFDRAKETLNIDHHVSNTKFAKHNIVEAQCSSTAEVVFDIIKNFCMVDVDIASAIYAGIISDTNGFKNKATSGSTHEKVAFLIKTGIPFTEIHNGLLNIRTMKETKVMAKALGKCQMENGIAYTTLTAQEMEECQAGTMDLEGIVESLISIDGAEVALFVYEKDDKTAKASLRSKEIDISEVAMKLGGGGHKLAAGCNSDQTVDELFEIVFAELKKRVG